MPTRKKKVNKIEAWQQLHDTVAKLLPHLSAVLDSEADFIEVRIKARDDGTCLGILKRYGSDGGKQVCFGAGYGTLLALVALDATISGGYWREETPWQPRENEKRTS